MNLKDSVLLLALIHIFVSSAGARRQMFCHAGASRAPATELYGFRLGMTIDQIKMRIPHLQLGRADESGVRKNKHHA